MVLTYGGSPTGNGRRPLIKYNTREFPHPAPEHSANDVVQQTPEIVGTSVGTSVKTIYSVLREYKKAGRVCSPVPPKPRRSILGKLDEASAAAIKEIVKRVTSDDGIIPTEKVRVVICEDASLPNYSRTTLYRILKGLNLFKGKVEKDKNK
ncbi:jg21881 [Pararge aegeria aegeria]|uniref:Jg21881 protein n=1 Tax=Pararge aegeria aegeria TaxID=348720 RepID=A0A8S4QTN6_9NEOP|nr:jg21881 [Pararge aegeria aegeria]